MRAEILSAIREVVEPLPYVHAMWEGGAAAWGRVDAYSDIDLQLDVDDDRVAEVAAIVEEALRALSPIEIRFELPQPTWHGHHQVFYRLVRAGRFLLVDFVVIAHTNPRKFLEPEIHGNALVHFDKRGVTTPPPFDHAALGKKLEARTSSLTTTFDLFQVLVEKELRRGNDAEALVFYHAFTLRPLVELLRIRHCPTRHDFHLRYYKHDLPPEIANRLERLAFPADARDLEAKWRACGTWFEELTGPAPRTSGR